MPWRGPDFRGEFPTLGYEVGAWIEENLIVPDGQRMGEPYLLTDEMWQNLFQTYRLNAEARPDMGSMAFRFYGTLMVRPQKYGKDPFAAAQVCAQALGPVRFAGWDSSGEPVGAPFPTPWIQCAGNAEEQTDNTFRPIVAMLRGGPIANTPGLDVGETRVNLPSGGRIEPVTASARARQGARITYVTMTESHLMTESSGGLKLARTLKRNAAGMDGRWLEITNAWDPSERSVAQQTYESKAPGVFLDYRPPRARIDLDDDAALKKELDYVYGDSSISKGGWVRIERIMQDIRDPATGEGEARRYFLNEVSVGSRDAVDMIKWVAQARPGETLTKGDRVALGFHGAQTRDATSLCASRLSDGRLFHLRTWERPEGVPEWAMPRQEVHEAVRDAFAAFTVECLMASPYGWQDEVNQWEGEFEKRVLEIWLNSEMRMDQIVERFLTAHRGDDITHDGTEALTSHAAGSALANGKRRPSAEERTPGMPDFYQRVVRKSGHQSISAFTAALLAYEARGWAIERGALFDDEGPPNLW